MIKITMRLFGAFRRYGEVISFSLPSGSTVPDVKNGLAVALNIDDRALIHDSALANDNEIIGGDAIFTRDCHLAILPPVCGG